MYRNVCMSFIRDCQKGGQPRGPAMDSGEWWMDKQLVPEVVHPYNAILGSNKINELSNHKSI